MQACQLIPQDSTQHKSYNDIRSRIQDPFSPTDSQRPEKRLWLLLLNSSMLGSISGGFLEDFHAGFMQQRRQEASATKKSQKGTMQLLKKT